LLAVVGSPGGSRIITAVLQTVLNVVDFGYNAQTAVAAARVHHQWLPDELYFEEGVSPDTLLLLRSYGHKVSPRNTFGHVMLIVRGADGWLEGGADPRRPGLVEGY
ncbi:MAG: gamma-glutamyltransferase, partial [Candidatus Eremiobacterota bacterium]